MNYGVAEAVNTSTTLLKVFTTCMFTKFYATCLSYNWGAIFPPPPFFGVKQGSNFQLYFPYCNLDRNFRGKHQMLLPGLIKFIESRR